jgi:hypothetical protein
MEIMTTNRRIRARTTRKKFPREAIDTFNEMRRLERRCTCEPVNPDEYWKHERCAACEQWAKLHGDLCDILHAKPWQWPLISAPGDIEPTRTKGYWGEAEAVDLYRQLEQAAARAA